MGLTPVLQALGRRLTLTKLRLYRGRLGLEEARLLTIALCDIPSLQSLAVAGSSLGKARLAALAPASYHNTSIKVFNISWNVSLSTMESTSILRDILSRNKTMTALDLSGNKFWETTGAVECIADGLGSNSTLWY
jgi:hypothetical protein